MFRIEKYLADRAQKIGKLVAEVEIQKDILIRGMIMIHPSANVGDI